MSGQSDGHRVILSKLNEQLTCKLCGGYFIDATTIIECLHSFCRSCIVKYLENNKYCPICEVQVHKSKPLLNIRPDHTLQDIVYKLVPGCYQSEMRCRREFYAKHPELHSEVTSPEARGEPVESHIYSPDESLSLSLEYFNPHAEDFNETDAVKDMTHKPLLRRYLRCPAAVTVFHLQKLIRAKYGLSDAHRVDIMYKEEPLCSSYTLMDMMYIYQWRRKVPLHLSYRIFESSLKRIKLSEDNTEYRKLLTNADIQSIETKDEKSLKREWKEVHLKISETGVMSITDISSTILKKDTETEDPQDQKICDETVTSAVAVNKTDSSIENFNMSKSCVEAKQSSLLIDGQLTSNSTFLEANSMSFIINDVKSTGANSSNNYTSQVTQRNGNVKQTNEMIDCTALTNLQQDTRETKGHNQINNIEDKLILQEQKAINQAMQFTEDNPLITENAMATDTKKCSINNNNISTDLAETQKECVKNTSEIKTGNAGSKIDALSAKLQFQPKMGQINNTYSKKTPREKRTTVQNAKKSDVKLLMEDAKARANYENITSKVLVSCSTAAFANRTTVSSATMSQNTSIMDSSSGTDKETHSEKNNQNTNIDVQQALNLLEQKTNSPMQTSMESTSKTSYVSGTIDQKLQCVQNTVTPSESMNTSIPAMNQTTSTFSYTVQDLVTNAAARSTLKTSSNSGVLQKPSGTLLATSMPNSQISSVPQFSIQTSSMSIYSIPSSLKSNYVNASQGVTTVTAVSTTTVMATTTATAIPMATTTSKSTSIPTSCPDAIPISLMKPLMRKQEMTAKGSNLNEICAKIGSNTTGSKINDICAKIGENSKEKNKMETRNRPDIPDLLKIAKKNPSPSLSNSDTTVKHIPNIPNVPVYTPSSNVTIAENKNVKTSLPTSTSVVPAAPISQKVSSLKKQSQSIGYKTLRDPPKSWNPTLSKNNYLAIKNQAKKMQNQSQISASEGTSKQIPSKPAKIFTMRNTPRYLGNPASGVKPMYGVANDTKEEQSTTSTKSANTLNMMKIDPKTLSPIVSTINSPIVSPPPYSPNSRSYQNTPFPREMCRNTGSPISPRNSPVNMLSTNPFIPSPTPNTNPRIIYSHFLPPFPDASRFPNPLIRSPIGIAPPSAFHSSLPPSINKLYQRSSYIPQTTVYSPVASQPPTVQRIPPSTHSSSPKSPKATSPSSISSTSFNLGKTEPQSAITSTDSVALLLSKSLPVSVPVAMPSQRELNAFNLSKTGSSTSVTSNIVKTSAMSTSDAIEAQSSKQNSPPISFSTAITEKSAEKSESTSSPTDTERKQCENIDAQETQETTRCKEESGQSIKTKVTEIKLNSETIDTPNAVHKKEKNQLIKINGDVTQEYFVNNKSKESNSNETATATEMADKDDQTEHSSPKEQNNISKSNVQTINDSTMSTDDNSKNENLNKLSEQTQSKKSEAQRNKAET